MCLSKDHFFFHVYIDPLRSRAQAQKSEPQWCVVTSVNVPGSPMGNEHNWSLEDSKLWEVWWVAREEGRREAHVLTMVLKLWNTSESPGKIRNPQTQGTESY